MLCEGAYTVCNKNATEDQAKWDTAFVYDSLESYLLAVACNLLASGQPTL